MRAMRARMGFIASRFLAAHHTFFCMYTVGKQKVSDFIQSFISASVQLKRLSHNRGNFSIDLDVYCAYRCSILAVRLADSPVYHVYWYLDFRIDSSEDTIYARQRIMANLQ